MIVAIPTNDRRTIALHTGRCAEFVFYEIENSQLLSVDYQENPHQCTHKKPVCKTESNAGHHTEILDLITRAEHLIYYGIGKSLQQKLNDNNVSIEKTQSVYLDEIISNYIEKNK